MKMGPIAGAAVALALIAPACGSDADDRGSSVPQPRPAAGQVATADVGASVLPDLVPKADLAMAPDDEVHVSYAPATPPPIARADQRVFEVHLEVLEGVCPLDPANDISTEMWGYRVAGDAAVQCGSPGPVLRGRVGDMARITLTNLAGNQHPHNIDFHAVTGQGGGAADLTVAPGETRTIEARLLYPGVFMYHCAFGDVPEHIARGMYGAFIVDPETPLPPVDHEWAVMQSEWYVAEPDDSGQAAFDREALFAEEPRYVTFNGRTDALAGDNALAMAVGERARIYMVNEGLNLDSNFHPIGSHWDVVYPEAATHPANRVIRGSQSTLVVAGGGTVVEMVGLVPSTIILVDHALVRTFYKGAIGQVVVTGDDDPEVYEAGSTGAGSSPAPSTTTTSSARADGLGVASGSPGAGAIETDEVRIPSGAFDPANAATAYSPPDIVVQAGTAVTWTNDDSVAHTVTSGSSDGRVGSADGVFDSGNMPAGATFSFTFESPGTYEYFCVPHPWMRGTVTVTE